MTRPPLPADPRPGTRPLEQTILGALGIQLIEATDQRVIACMPVSDDVRDGRGMVSAGALLVLSETAASTGAGLAAGPGRRAFGVEIDGALVADVASGSVTCTAIPVLVEPGRQVWHMRIVDDEGAAVGDARCTLAIRDLPAG